MAHNPGLDKICGRFRARLKTMMFEAGIARILLAGFAVFLVLSLLDWWLHLETLWRIVSLLAFLAAVGATGWFTLIRPLGRPWSNEQVLAYVDSVAPPGDGMLLDLYELQRGDEIAELDSPVGSDLARRAVSDLGPLAQRAEISRALYGRKARRWVRLAFLAAIVLIVAGAFLAYAPKGNYTRAALIRFFNPFSEYAWPHRTTITLNEPEHGWFVPQMDPLLIEARVTGDVPTSVFLTYKSDSAEDWVTEKILVQNGVATYRFDKVVERIRFSVRGGDYTTKRYEVGIIARPYIKRIIAHYEYPVYAKLAPESKEGGQLSGLEGTVVRLVFESSMPLDKAVFTLREGDNAPVSENLTRISADKFEKTSLILRSAGTYEVELFEKHGFKQARPERYEIRVTADKLPRVQITAPARDLVKTRQATVDIAFRADDDFGLESVEFLYQLGESNPQPLPSAITGPIAIPKGMIALTSEKRFSWDLRQMKDLPEQGELTYWVRVKDCNPTPGRPSVDSAKFKIRLEKKSELHLQAVERAKKLIAEARIAWDEQLAAWYAGEDWLKKPTGEDNDANWVKMEEKQDGAIRAGRAMQLHMQTLTGEYQSNHMAREFMAGRLTDIGTLITRLVETEHPAIQEALKDARPQLDSQARPDFVKDLRTKAAAKFRDHQKYSILVLYRIVRRLYDWNDLQYSTITSALLHERQEEVIKVTEQIAPRYIGKPMEDLTDDEQKDLLTLGSRQEAIYETERELENQLSQMIYAAEIQKRMTILAPLKTAFKLLRDNRVQDHLKEAAKLIKNNQAYDVLKFQKDALFAMNIVMSGLAIAGQKVDTEPDPKLTDVIPAREEVEPPELKPVETKSEEEPGSEVVVPPISIGVLGQNIPQGSDPLSALIALCVEEQESVRGRVRFLGDNLNERDMPRFRRLMRGVLEEREDKAIDILAAAGKKAEEMKVPVATEIIASAQTELKQFRELIAKENYSKCHQSMQICTMALLKDLLTPILPRLGDVKAAVETNKRNEGKDAFKREFVLQPANIDAAAAMIGALDHACVLEIDVIRKLKRFIEFAEPTAADPFLAGLEKANRAAASAAQKRIAALAADVKAKAATFTAELQPRVNDGAKVGPLLATDFAKPADEILVGTKSKDEELVKTLEGSAEVLARALMGMTDLLVAFHEPKEPEGALPTPTEPMTPEKQKELTSQDWILGQLKESEILPQDVREVMVRALEKPLPDRYAELLKAYYRSFVDTETAPKKEQK